MDSTIIGDDGRDNVRYFRYHNGTQFVTGMFGMDSYFGVDILFGIE